MDSWAVSGSHAEAEEASALSEAEVHGNRREHNSDFTESEVGVPAGEDAQIDTGETDSEDYESDTSDEIRLVHANHIPESACKIVDNEEYQQQMDLPSIPNKNDEETLKMIRAHVAGGMMAEYKYIHEGVDVYQMNMTYGNIGLGQWNLEKMAELVVDDDSLEKCQQNPANFLLHPMMKDVVTFDNVNNKFKPILNSDILRQLADEIYRTGTANQERKNADQTHKSQNMNQPENRKQYMAANDMLVNMMVRIYNENCRSTEETVSWDEIRQFYEGFRDSEHRHHDLFEQYAKILPLEKASLYLNQKSVKLIFGRSHLKDFLSEPIYHKIKFIHDKQIQLSLNDKVENCIYTEDAYKAVEEEIQRRKHTGNPFARKPNMTKEQRKQSELEEKKKSFVPIPLPNAHVPVANEPSTNIFGTVVSPEPKREKENYCCSPVRQESPQHEQYGDPYAGDSDASSYCARPVEENNYTDSEEEVEKNKKPVEKEPAPPSYSNNPSQNVNNADNRKPVEKEPSPQSTSNDPFQSFKKPVDDYDSDLSSDCERPLPTGNKNFTDDEDDVEEKTRQIEQERRRKEEKRRLAKEQKEKKEEEEKADETRFFTRLPNGSMINPTPQDDRLNLELNIETVEEKAEVSNPVTTPGPDERLQSFVNNSDKGGIIYDDLSEDELFKTEIIKCKKPIYQRPQMPNEQHPLHRQQKELEHQQALAEKEKARKAKEEAKKKQEEDQKRAAREEQERIASEERKRKEQEEMEKAQREAEKKRLLQELEIKEMEEEARIRREREEQERKREAHRSAFSSVGNNPPMGLFSRAASNIGGSVFEEAGFGKHHKSPTPSNRSSSNAPHHPPQYNSNNKSPRQQMAHDGIPFPRGPSRQDMNFMEPPAPQLGATRHKTAIRYVDVGTQSEPIDAIFEELGFSVISGGSHQDPENMSPKEFFLQYIASHVYAYRGDNVNQRMWSTMQNGLSAPFDRPESFLGDDWIEVIERELPKVGTTKTRKSGIMFEWMGD